MTRFNQVGDERDLAFASFQKAAGHFGLQMKETGWHQFGA
jgi:hypothetical protein